MWKRGTRRLAGAGSCALLTLAVSAPTASAQKIHGIPTISGTPQSGHVLTASAFWSPPKATPTYSWLRCVAEAQQCAVVQSNASPQYRVSDADVGRRLQVRLSFLGRGDDAISVATAPVSPAPAPVAPPTPTAVPPPPPQTFDVPPAPTPTPVPTQGAVLQEQGTRLRMMRPAPRVRIAGRLTLTGARVTLFSVRAPRRARITVSCRGTGCPRTRFATRQRLVRLRPFERVLPAGTRLEVRVQRRGYYGKSTVIVIRRGKAPARTDRCLSARGARIRCPESS